MHTFNLVQFERCLIYPGLVEDALVDIKIVEAIKKTLAKNSLIAERSSYGRRDFHLIECFCSLLMESPSVQSVLVAVFKDDSLCAGAKQSCSHD